MDTWVPHSILHYYLTLLFKDAILQYDHIFHIHCDARDIQLGADIPQWNACCIFFS
jgi:hypothetical protein